jgi:HSP20 family molecular chaperone IbpA
MFSNVLQYPNSTVFEVSLAGMDPKDVKVSYCLDEGRIYVNGWVALSGVNSKYSDLGAAKAELKHGLLTVTIPIKKPERVEIPLTVG